MGIKDSCCLPTRLQNQNLSMYSMYPYPRRQVCHPAKSLCHHVDGHVCPCQPGYKLQSNSHSCLPTSERGKLMAGQPPSPRATAESALHKALWLYHHPCPSWTTCPQSTLKLHNSKGWTPRAGAGAGPQTLPATSCELSHFPSTPPGSVPISPMDASTLHPALGFFLMLSSCLRVLHPPAPNALQHISCHLSTLTKSQQSFPHASVWTAPALPTRDMSPEAEGRLDPCKSVLHTSLP